MGKSERERRRARERERHRERESEREGGRERERARESERERERERESNPTRLLPMRLARRYNLLRNHPGVSLHHTYRPQQTPRVQSFKESALHKRLARQVSPVGESHVARAWTAHARRRAPHPVRPTHRSGVRRRASVEA